MNVEKILSPQEHSVVVPQNSLTCKDLIKIRRIRESASVVLKASRDLVLPEQFEGAPLPIRKFVSVASAVKYPDESSQILSPSQEEMRSGLKNYIKSSIRNASSDEGSKSLHSALKTKRKQLRLEKERKRQKEQIRIRQVVSGSDKSILGLDKFPWTISSQKPRNATHSLSISRKVYRRSTSE